MATKEYTFDLCFTFAEEQRDYVEAVYEELNVLGIETFYDKQYEVELWGENLVEALGDIYRTKARYCIMFVSKAYAEKVWTKYEKRVALERAIHEHDGYIWPVRFDDTVIPGLLDSILYMEASQKTPQEIAKIIAKKLAYSTRGSDGDVFIQSSLDGKELYEGIVTLLRKLVVDTDIKPQFLEENNHCIAEFCAEAKLIYRFTVEVDGGKIYLSNINQNIHSYNYNGIATPTSGASRCKVNVVNLGLFDESKLPSAVLPMKQFLETLKELIMEDIRIARSKELQS